MVRKLCVFPNDSLLSYYKKGEIKERYFNPKNWFDEVHVVSLFDEEIEAHYVKTLAGTADLVIHKFGKANLTNYKGYERRVNDILKEIKPDLIRSYNPLVQGWIAAKCAKNLNIPLVVSLHTNYEQQRLELKKERYLQYLKLSYAAKTIEPFVFKNADAVICVYRFTIPYAEKMGAKNIHLIYNKVDLDKFSPTEKELVNKKPTIISVGRLIDQKNHRYLIEAVKDLDVQLIIIGDGPNYNSLTEFADKISVNNKVQFIKRVPNEELVKYYRSATIYAQPMENLGGIPMPVLEAMACGLPIVMSKREHGQSEDIDDSIYFVENDPKEFARAFSQIISDTTMQKSLRNNVLNRIRDIGGEQMENKELSVYQQLIELQGK